MSDFSWVGNELCLDFHNTKKWTGDRSTPGRDELDSLETLTDWCVRAGILEPGSGEDPGDDKGFDPAVVLRQARAVRSIIHQVFSPSGAVPDRGEWYGRLNDYLALVVMRVSVNEKDSEPLMVVEGTGELYSILAPVVWSAASLLVSPFRESIGQCASPTCGRLYVDLSRRGNRRWCDMTTCGNREKARRHSAKHSKT